MTAYKEGKIIEYKYVTKHNTIILDFWVVAANPRWDWINYDYRIKPEPKYRPYANEDECFKDACKHGIWLKGIDETTRGYHSVFSIMPKGIKTFPVYPTYEQMLKIYVWADDGTPCGILEEE